MRYIKNFLSYTNLSILFIIGSVLFFSSLLPISPIFIFYVLFLYFFFFFIFIKKGKIFIDEVVFSNLTIAFLLFIYLLFYFFLNSENIVNNKIIFQYILYVLCFFFVAQILNNRNQIEIVKIANCFLIFCLLFFSLETILRIGYGWINKWDLIKFYGWQPKHYFYVFKEFSFFGEDSNAVGVALLLISCFSLYLQYRLQRKNHFFNLYFFLLLILSFSRAAIVTYCFCFCLFFLYNINNKKVKKYLIFISSCCFIFFIFFIFYSDDSFNTKFAIISNTVDYLKKSSKIALFLGAGVNSIDIAMPEYYYKGHNLFCQLIVEFGLIGFVAFLSYALFLCKKSNWQMLYVIIPHFIVGFSYAPICISYEFVIFAFIYMLEKSFLRGKHEF